jgi:hypothetical protein
MSSKANIKNCGLVILMVFAGDCYAQDMDLIDYSKLPREIWTRTPKPENEEWKRDPCLVNVNYEKERLHKEIGLKDGDVIKKLNGKSLAPDDLVLVDLRLRESKSFSLVVVRDGEEVTVLYRRPK